MNFVNTNHQVSINGVYGVLNLATVNSIQWAPHEWGLLLACGSSDESISFISTSGIGLLCEIFIRYLVWFLIGDGNWKYTKIDRAHSVGYSIYMNGGVLTLILIFSLVVMLLAGLQLLIQAP